MIPRRVTALWIVAVDEHETCSAARHTVVRFAEDLIFAWIELAFDAFDDPITVGDEHDAFERPNSHRSPDAVLATLLWNERAKLIEIVSGPPYGLDLDRLFAERVRHFNPRMRRDGIRIFVKTSSIRTQCHPRMPVAGAM